jgi:hypothetical protein
VVRVPGYRSRGLGSIPSATRFSEKMWAWNGAHSASVSTIEELLERKGGGFSLENQDYTVGICCADHTASLHPQKLAGTSPASGGRSVGIVHSQTKATEFSLLSP